MNQNIKTEISYPDNSFDVVILFAVLTCIASDQDQKCLIKEIQRVLKPNGIIYISDYLIQNDESNIVRYQQFLNKYKCYGIFELEEGAILRHHSKEYMNRLLKSFQTIWYRKINVLTMNGDPSEAFQYMGKLGDE